MRSTPSPQRRCGQFYAIPKRSGEAAMDLNVKQTRRFLLGSGITFPRHYPTTGTVSLDVGHFSLRAGAKPVDKELLIVQESGDISLSLHVFLREDVLGCFVPGNRDENGVFHISYEPHVKDFEQGEWFLDHDLCDLKVVRNRLSLPAGADISSRDSVLRGIAFVSEDSRTLRITEVAQLAGECESEELYTCCYLGNTCCW